MTCCSKCGQPLPQEPRRDPPLPPLPYTSLVTIHDLSEEEKARAVIKVHPTMGHKTYELDR